MPCKSAFLFFMLVAFQSKDTPFNAFDDFKTVQELCRGISARLHETNPATLQRECETSSRWSCEPIRPLFFCLLSHQKHKSNIPQGVKMSGWQSVPQTSWFCERPKRWGNSDAVNGSLCRVLVMSVLSFKSQSNDGVLFLAFHGHKDSNRVGSFQMRIAITSSRFSNWKEVHFISFDWRPYWPSLLWTISRQHNSIIRLWEELTHITLLS